VLEVLAVLACTFAGFSLIALTQAQHRARVAVDAAPQGRAARRLQRAAGAGVLALSLWVALSLEAADFAALLWVLSIVLGAQLVAVALALRPGLFRIVLGVEARLRRRA
jgi:hypothetical protein